MISDKKLFQTVIDISGEISPTLGKTIKAVTKRLDFVNLKALAVGSAIGAVAITTGVAVAKSTKYLAKLGDEFNSAVNNISASTGLVGEELTAMGDVVKEVYGSNLGESMEDAAAGVAEIYKATGLTDEALATTTKGAFALADTFGYDVAESARAAKAMMTNFGVSGEEAMNLIATGAQNGLDYSGEMIDSINEYSVQFAKLGFSADDMFNIFQQGADSGAWNLDKVGDAVKEFSIRSIDGSKTTIHAFQALGLNADDMMQTFAAGGEGAASAFTDVLTSLMDMEDQVQRDAIGVELFGTQWEDLGTEAMQAMADMQVGAYATKDAIGGIMDVKYDNLTDAMEGIKRTAEVTLLPLATNIANAFTRMAPTIQKIFEQLGPVIEEVTEQVMPFVDDFLDGIADLIPQIMPMVMELAEAILPLLSTFVQQLLPPLLDLIQQILPPMTQIIEAILPILTQALNLVLPLITQIAGYILPTILDVLAGLLPTIQPLLEILMSILESVIMPLMEPITLLVEALLPVISPILDAINAVLAPLAPILQVIGEVLGVIIGAIAKVVGWIADGLSWLVKLIFGGGGDTEAADKVNGYATGGFTNGLSIAGEDPRYPTEAVISFNPAYRAQNLSYWAQAGRMLGAESSDFSLGGDSGGTSIDMGGVTFAPNITIVGQADKQTVMDAIEAEYPEFVDMLEEWFAGRGKPVYA